MASSGRLAAVLWSLLPAGLGLTLHGHKGNNSLQPQVRSASWIESVNFMLPVEKIDDPGSQTAIVTFAGKRNMEYIDGAVMLGMSIKKHLPGYPMVALTIENIAKKNKQLLRKAGWHITEVPNWETEYCGKDCDLEFLGRWHDSFEKINTFRLPFERILFLDSDTYIFNSRIQQLLNETELPDGHIAMAKDGCKNEFNSGVMLYKPDLKVFTGMLQMVSVKSREQILDQNLVNEAFRGKIKEISNEFNCVDTIGIQPGTQKEACDRHCSQTAVVAHFTGHPKPTAAKRKQLELVRRPGAPALACKDTNFGACAKWSEFYCDLRLHQKKLSKNIRHWLKNTGGCCHSPFDPQHDAESCKECPSTIELRDDLYGSEARWPKQALGTYLRSTTKSKFNGGRPVYVRQEEDGPQGKRVYMYFIQKQQLWVIGTNHSTNTESMAYSGKEAQCPRDASAWAFWNGTAFERRRLTVKGVPNGQGAPNSTEHILWNVQERRWEFEEMPEGFWQSKDKEDKDDKDDEF